MTVRRESSWFNLVLGQLSRSLLPYLPLRWFLRNKSCEIFLRLSVIVYYYVFISPCPRKSLRSTQNYPTIGSFRYIKTQLDSEATRTQRKFKNHFYSFLLFVSSVPRHRVEFKYFERSLLLAIFACKHESIWSLLGMSGGNRSYIVKKRYDRRHEA